MGGDNERFISIKSEEEIQSKVIDSCNVSNIVKYTRYGTDKTLTVILCDDVAYNFIFSSEELYNKACIEIDNLMELGGFNLSFTNIVFAVVRVILVIVAVLYTVHMKYNYINDITNNKIKEVTFNVCSMYIWYRCSYN
ncbi:MAG: hypothetical protein QXD03_05160 [Candidatus Anstonellales archaeon]